MSFNKDLLLHGSRDEIDVPAHLNFGWFLYDCFKKGGDRIALRCVATGKSVTYSELLQRSVNLAEVFRKNGLKKGDVVCICSEARIEFMIATVAIIFNGAIVTTANYAYGEGEMSHLLNLSKPKWILCPIEVQETFKNLFVDIKCILFDDTFDKMIRTHKNIDEFTVPDVKGQLDTAVILFSSGTTGLPKGVELTHLNYIISCKLIANANKLNEKQLMSALSPAPWFHTMGFTGTLCYLSANRTLVFLNKFTPEQYLKSIEQYKIDIVVAVPPMVLFLAKSPLVDKYDLSSIRSITVGAAPLSDDTILAVKKRLGQKIEIIQGFGMTEITFGAARDDDGVNPGSCGTALATCTLKFVDITTGKTLGPHNRGELRIKAGGVMKGYLNNPEATAEAFDEDGFLKTGDIGYYDEKGFIYVVDRIKELIKYKAFQVPPAEVEAVLLEHPDIADCAVVGKSDEVAGELPVAFVVKKRMNLSEKEVIDFVAGKLSHAKQLHGGVIFVESIPKNPSGKILRKILKESIAKNEKSKL